MSSGAAPAALSLAKFIWISSVARMTGRLGRVLHETQQSAAVIVGSRKLDPTYAATRLPPVRAGRDAAAARRRRLRRGQARGAPKGCRSNRHAKATTAAD